MEGATHFKEQFKLSTGTIVNTAIRPIDELKSSIAGTFYAGLKTVAVFKIKFKPGYPKIINQ